MKGVKLSIKCRSCTPEHETWFMAGYSGTPLPKKLGIKEHARVAIFHAPKEFVSLLTPLPKEVALVSGASKGRFDVMVFFTKSAASLKRSLPRLRQQMISNGGLWIAWPKKASGVKTDVTEDVVRREGISAGLVDNKVCAIDDTWSGLRLVIRLKDR